MSLAWNADNGAPRTPSWAVLLLLLLGALGASWRLAPGAPLPLRLALSASLAAPLALTPLLAGSRLLVTHGGTFHRHLLLLALPCGALAHWLARRMSDHGLPWDGGVLLPLLFGGLYSLLLAVGGWRLRGHGPSSRRRAWRVLETLGDELAGLRDADLIRQRVEGALSRWLPDSTIHLVELRPGERDAVPHLPEDCHARLASGHRVWTHERPWPRHLLVPIRSRGALREVLRVRPRGQAALYTEVDLLLLDACARLAAAALRHAEELEAGEAERRVEQGAVHAEARRTLDALVAELSHELAYPLNFFRYLLQHSRRGEPLSGQDVEIGLEEVERLERMLLSLRQLATPPPRLESIAVVPRLQRAAGLIRELVQEKRLAVALEVPDGLHLMAEADAMVQLFANLLRNAAQAVEPGGRLGVRYLARGDGHVLEVWDSGPGVPEALSAAIFTPRFTTRAGGQGLGLAITQRIARGFGWTLQLHQEPGRTAFRVLIPPIAGAASAPRRDNP